MVDTHPVLAAARTLGHGHIGPIVLVECLAGARGEGDYAGGELRGLLATFTEQDPASVGPRMGQTGQVGCVLDLHCPPQPLSLSTSTSSWGCPQSRSHLSTPPEKLSLQFGAMERL